MICAALPRERHNLHFRRLDINDLDYVDQFDVIFSNAALHWVKDHQRLFRNVHRALRRGGLLRCNFAGEGNCAGFFSVIREAMAQREFQSFFAGFEWPWYMPPVDAYRALAESSGLHDVKVWGENADRHFPDEQALTRWIDQPSLVPFLAHVDDRWKDAFRDFVVGRMIEATQQEDGRCFETFRRINVSAVKKSAESGR